MKFTTVLGWLIMAALAGCIATIAFQTGHIARLATRVDRFEACEAAVAGKAKARPVGEVCSKVIAAAGIDADRERACSAALAGDNTFTVRMVCGSPTKTLYAQREAAQGEATNLRDQLATTVAGQAAALRRAEEAGRTQELRKAKRDAAVQAAPRDADGLVVCDDGCLRDRFGH